MMQFMIASHGRSHVPTFPAAMLLLFLLVLVSPSVPADEWDRERAAETASLLHSDQWFAAALFQDGALHPVLNRRIALRPAPFAIVVAMHEPDGLLVNANVAPDIYRGVVKKRSLDEILDEPDMFMGMAETLFNEERTLYVSASSPHYLYYFTPEDHRYDRIDIIDGVVIGHRFVEFLWDLEGEGFGGPSGTVPVEEMVEPLYLSFFYATWEAEGRVEHQSAAVEVVFQ